MVENTIARMAKIPPKTVVANEKERLKTLRDDLKKTKWSLPFTRMIRVKPGETVVFAYIVFKSRAHRDRVNAKVMKDLAAMGDQGMEMPFDVKRMAYGGFKVIVGK